MYDDDDDDDDIDLTVDPQVYGRSLPNCSRILRSANVIPHLILSQLCYFDPVVEILKKKVTIPHLLLCDIAQQKTSVLQEWVEWVFLKVSE